MWLLCNVRLEMVLWFIILMLKNVIILFLLIDVFIDSKNKFNLYVLNIILMLIKFVILDFICR